MVRKPWVHSLSQSIDNLHRLFSLQASNIPTPFFSVMMSPFFHLEQLNEIQLRHQKHFSSANFTWILHPASPLSIGELSLLAHKAHLIICTPDHIPSCLLENILTIPPHSSVLPTFFHLIHLFLFFWFILPFFIKTYLFPH